MTDHLTLDRLVASDFETRLGTVFTMTSDNRETPIELVEVTTGPPRAEGRQPFSLVFRGPANEVWPQRMYRIAVPDLGEMDVFLVPIGPDSAGQRYEAVFG